eukprot:scaffold205266_cov49-Prasinocladus_malaysianus.AAC.1
MVVVHHGGDTIKSEAIKLELIHPVAGVGQEIPKSLPVACITSPKWANVGIAIPRRADLQMSQQCGIREIR